MQDSIIATYLHGEDPEYLEIQKLDRWEVACAVFAPDTYLLVADIETASECSDYEPQQIDMSEVFGSAGFRMTASPDGQYLALFGAGRKGALVVKTSDPLEGNWVTLPTVPRKLVVTNDGVPEIIS